MIVSTARFLFSLIVLSLISNEVVVAFDEPWTHPHSLCAPLPHHHAHHNCFQPDVFHSRCFQPHLTPPGGYSMCEPYVPDVSLNDFSLTRDIWNGGLSGGSPVRVTSGRGQSVKVRSMKIQNNNPHAKWIKNPFCKDGEKNNHPLD